MDSGHNDEMITQFARALFSHARASKKTTKTLEAAERLMQVYRDSTDFRRFIAHPRFKQESVRKVLDALDDKLALGTILRKHLALLSRTRNLTLFPKVFERLRDYVAEEQGEVKAHIVSANALSATERRAVENALSERLALAERSEDSSQRSKSAVKSAVKPAVPPIVKVAKQHLSLSFSEDATLLSGLVITMRSCMIDLSLRSELRRLRSNLSLERAAT